MSSPFIQAMKTEWRAPPDTIALVRFQATGIVDWYHSIPPTLSRGQVEKYIRIFLASQSVFQAFSDPADRTSTDDKAHHVPQSTSVVCDDGVTIMANPCCPNSSAWYGIFGRNYPLQPNPTLDLHILPALQQAATHLNLYASKSSPKHDDLQCIFKSVCKNAVFDQDWNTFILAPKLVRRALIDLVDNMKSITNHCPAYSTPRLYKSPYFHHLAATFCSTMSQVFSSTDCTFCIISPDERIVYVNRPEPGLAASFLWYYARVLNIGKRSGRREVRDVSDCGILRLCYRYRRWVLLTQISPTSDRLGYNHATIRHAAHPLVVFARDHLKGVKGPQFRSTESNANAEDESTSARN